jgi:hypothetical protein
MDDRTEKIFNIAFDPRGNEQEAISAFLRLRKLGNVSDMKSKVESIQPKAPQHRPSYNNYRSVPQYPSAQSSWATFTGGLIGLHLIYTYCSAFNKEGVCVQVRKASDLTNKSCSFEFRFVSYTDASLDLNLLLNRLSKTMHNYGWSSENNAPTCANHRSKNQHRKTNQQKNGGISFSKFHH